MARQSPVNTRQGESPEQLTSPRLAIACWGMEAYKLLGVNGQGLQRNGESTVTIQLEVRQQRYHERDNQQKCSGRKLCNLGVEYGEPTPRTRSVCVENTQAGATYA